jgi:hypothetical protein
MRITRAFRLLAAIFAISVAGSCTSDISTAPDYRRTAPVTEPVIDTALAAELDAQRSELLGELLGGTTQLIGSLLTCEARPFQAGQAWIGPSGGVLTLGANSLVIPRGALTQYTLIRAELPSDPVASIRFLPEGLEFARPVYLTLSYQHCNLVAGLLTPKRVAYTTERLRILEFVPTVDNILTRKVTGQLEHFSRYAVAW